LKNIVTFDDVTPQQIEAAENAGLKTYHYRDVISEGLGHPEHKLREATAESIYMFCYASGTTGDPKGAKMSNRGFMATMSLHEYADLGMGPGDVCISYLPYAHIFE